MPSTPIGLEIAGPCRVEFKADVIELSQLRVQGTINIFGIVMPLSNQNGDVEVYERAPSFRCVGALSLEAERVSKNGAPTGDDGNAGDGGEVAASKKRKLENDANVAPPEQPPSDPRSGDRI